VDGKRAADLYAQGWTLRQIGAELGVSGIDATSAGDCSSMHMVEVISTSPVETSARFSQPPPRRRQFGRH
jgi:hypothetical protein